MSLVEMPGICYCECHDDSIPYEARIRHGFACCMGRCHVCKKNYTYAAHVEDCEKRIADLMAEHESRSK